MNEALEKALWYRQFFFEEKPERRPCRDSIDEALRIVHDYEDGEPVDIDRLCELYDRITECMDEEDENKVWILNDIERVLFEN